LFAKAFNRLLQQNLPRTDINGPNPPAICRRSI
jgi:hypothetical protein